MTELSRFGVNKLSEGGDCAFVTANNGTIYVNRYHKNILNEHGVEEQEVIDLGRFRGGDGIIEIYSKSFEINIPVTKEGRETTSKILTELGKNEDEKESGIPIYSSFDMNPTRFRKNNQ